jgi:hypothetical protein
MQAVARAIRVKAVFIDVFLSVFIVDYQIGRE